MSYLLHLLVVLCLYAVLAQSLNLIVGYGGLLSLSHGAFYGIGAYATSLLILEGGWTFLPGLAAATVSVAALAWLMAMMATRLRGDSFVLATVGVQMVVFAVLNNWTAVTRGARGITGIPRPTVFGFTADTLPAFLLPCLGITGLCLLLLQRLMSSPYGRVLQAIREDELAAISLGKDVAAFKRSAFSIAAAFAAVAGALFASFARYIDPTSFDLTESIFVLTAVIVGGAGSIAGPLVGATLLVLLPEMLRFAGIPDSVAANLRQIIYGTLLVLLMRLRPRGIAGRYSFG